jgi:omega-amidase
MLHAHLIQLNIEWENKPANHARVLELLDDTALNRGDLIVLPELFDVGFTLDIDASCDDDGSTHAFLQMLASDSGCTIHGSRAIRTPSATKAYNCATITSADSQGSEFHKIHPFSFGREMESYEGGQTVMTYQWQSMRVCPAVCYDLRFPELFRIGVQQGAEVFALGANWPATRAHHWRSLLISRAIENQAYVLGVNRCGDDPHLSYSGGTIAINPKGEIIGELGQDEQVLSVAVDPDLVRTWRQEFTALKDIKLI